MNRRLNCHVLTIVEEYLVKVSACLLFILAVLSGVGDEFDE